MITTWFQINPTRTVKGLYALTYKMRGKASKHYRAQWLMDFNTRAEALAEGERRGWILVTRWDEADAHDAKIDGQRRAEYQALTEARKGLVEVRIGSKNDGYELYWVTPEAADAVRNRVVLDKRQQQIDQF